MIRRHFLSMLGTVVAALGLQRLIEMGHIEAETVVEFPAEITSLEGFGDFLYLTTAEPALYRIDRQARVRRLGDLPLPMRLQQHQGRLLLGGEGDDDAWYALDVQNLWGISWSA